MFAIPDDDEEVIIDWLSTKKLRTGRYYMEDINLLYLILEKPLREMGAEEIERVISAHDPKPGTGRRRLSAIRSLLQYATRSGYLPYNVAAEINHKSKEAPRVEGTYLTEGDMQRLFRITDDRIWGMIALSYYCSMTAPEIAILRWSDISADYRVTLRGRFAREVSIPPKVVERLTKLRAMDERVFPSRLHRSEVLDENTIRRLIREPARALGLEHVTPMQIRVSRVMHLISRGASPVELCGLTGLSYRTVSNFFHDFHRTTAGRSAQGSMGHRRGSNERFARS